MNLPTYKDLLDAGVHFGHQRRKWDPKMKPYIFMEKNGIHVIDLNKTITSLEKAGRSLKQFAKSGRKIMFVATKKQARDIVADAALSVGMPYVTERWLGGMMTNFSTVRRSIKKMNNIDRILADQSITSVTKKERLTLTRERNKIEKVLGGITNLNRLPHALFIVDIVNEHLALDEARKLGIKTFGMVDTNSNPTKVDFAIPANDDSTNSIKIITDYAVSCIKEGLEERQKTKESLPTAKAEESKKQEQKQ